jgi:PPOX class probable F420-dependent enzyme
MTQSRLSESAKEMLAKANPAVISTVRSDGQPVSAATWYLLRGDQLLVNLDEGRIRLEHIRNDPRVSLTVLDEGDWYTHVTVVGRVADIYDDEGLADIDELSRHYTGEPYANRDRARVSALIDVDRVSGWGAQKNNNQANGRPTN